VQNWNFCLPGRGSEVGKFCSEYVQGPPDYVILNRLLLNRAGKVTYQDRHSIFNNSMSNAIRRGAAESEVQKT